MSADRQADHVASPSQADAILRAASHIFAERGFHGTTVRELARSAGVSQPLVYHYYSSKHDLLVAMVDKAFEDLMAAINSALAAAPDEPAAQLAALVSAHVLHEASHREMSFVANTELRSLVGEARTAFIAKRDVVQRMYDRLVKTACAEAVGETEFVRETARAIATMCTAVTTWFHEDGSMSAAAIAHRYSTIALRAVGLTHPGKDET